MMTITRMSLMGTCAGLLGALSLTSIAMAQVGGPGPTPAPNCQCGPVDDCNGVPLTATGYCPGACGCEVTWNEDETCIIGLRVVCWA